MHVRYMAVLPGMLLLLFGGITATMLAVGLTRENKKRERGERDCLDQHKLENLGIQVDGSRPVVIGASICETV